MVLAQLNELNTAEANVKILINKLKIILLSTDWPRGERHFTNLPYQCQRNEGNIYAWVSNKDRWQGRLHLFCFQCKPFFSCRNAHFLCKHCICLVSQLSKPSHSIFSLDLDKMKNHPWSAQFWFERFGYQNLLLL